MPLLAAERQDRILGRLRREGTVSVTQIAIDCEVTAETVRRDLGRLAQQGMLDRVHGGATLPVTPSRSESPWQDRRARRTAQKRAIAEAARDYIPTTASSSVLLDAGSTTEMLADVMVSGSSASTPAGTTRYVVTNAVPIAAKLADVDAFDVETLGGRVRRLTGAVVGESAVETLSRRRCDVAFLGTNGIDAGFGLSTPNPSEAAVKTAMIRAAHTVVLLADSAKLDRCSLVRFAALEEVSVLITDAEPRPALRQALREAEVTVVRAVAP